MMKFVKRGFGLNLVGGANCTSARFRHLIRIKTERSDIPDSTAAVGMPPPPGTAVSSGLEVNIVKAECSLE
ncbi:hypothetical protein CDAR_541291 [Caerostris darwini]|uniref:Uncharacterized protein n=1 Tax=Caerostris darwini TaxID=1538125 RepID=A0AAV4RQD4_9ARAC|nr:hypothetical protein CDAR_541291 [Caerostris darwini]